jgi:hypothetical protein
MMTPRRGKSPFDIAVLLFLKASFGEWLLKLLELLPLNFKYRDNGKDLPSARPLGSKG